MTRYTALQRYSVALGRLAKARRRAARRGATAEDRERLATAEGIAARARHAAQREAGRPPAGNAHV